jgi:hypothetical protein
MCRPESDRPVLSQKAGQPLILDLHMTNVAKTERIGASPRPTGPTRTHPSYSSDVLRLGASSGIQNPESEQLVAPPVGLSTQLVSAWLET